MRTSRTILTTVLLGIGAIALIAANVGVWVQRDIYDTDGFVSTTDEVFRDDDVQAAIAERFATRLYESSNLEARLREELPDGLKFLAIPLANQIRQFLDDAALRVLERERVQDLLEVALRKAHEEVRRVIDSDSVDIESDSVVIDLRPVLDEVVSDIGLQDQLQGGGAAEGTLLDRLQLPEDAGRFEIENAAAAWTFRIARYGEEIIWITTGVAVALLVLAVLVALNRPRALGIAGILVALVGAISLLSLVPVRMYVEDNARSEDAALSIVNIVTEQFQLQSFILVAAGIAIACVAFLFGGSRLAVALRNQVRGRSDPQAPFTEVARGYATPLRVAGFGIAAVLLLAWPEPTTRVYVTLLVLLAVYLLGVWLLTSDMPAASDTRARAGDLWSRYFVTSSSRTGAATAGWVGAHAGVLRLAGVGLALLVLLVLPEVTIGLFVAVIALLFVYLAGVDLLSHSRS
jgi:hypothetical protein